MRSYREYKISEIGKIVSGATPKTSIPENYGGNIAWITPADLSGYQEKYISRGARNITQAGYDSCSAQLMPAGTVLLSSRAPIGYVAIAQNPICTNQGFKSIVPNDSVDSEFLYYQLKYLQKQIQEMGSGTTFKEISAKKLGEVKIVVPSISEQKRIVARIEELFSELDNGVETLRKTKQQLAVYRQAVLKDAFGQISEDDYKPLSEVIAGSPQNGLYKPRTAYGQGTRILRIDGFYDGKILSDYDFKRLQLSQSEIRQYQLHSGDLVVNRVNSMPYLGKCALVRELDDITVFESNIMRMSLNSTKVDPEYVTYYLSSFMGRKELTKNAKQAVNQASINQGDVVNSMVPVPESIDEQRKAVLVIKARLSVCDNIEKTVDTALQQAEAMRQSILKQAFEGRL